jgi:thiol-disulfide isomerase/thioredoxin
MKLKNVARATRNDAGLSQASAAPLRKLRGPRRSDRLSRLPRRACIFRLPLAVLVGAWLLASSASAAIEAIDFWNPTCGPCVQIKPIIDGLAQAGYPIRSCNTADGGIGQQLAMQYGINAVPVIVFTDNGREVGRLTGVAPNGEISQQAIVSGLRQQSPAPANGRRSANFVVTASTPELASEIANSAEHWRVEMAKLWLGHTLPNWSQPCPVRASVSPSLGAGGATSFVFDRGEVFKWKMTIQGSRERLLDSVLPHEVSHTIFATHFRQPLPRWIDEGACTTVEGDIERSKQDGHLVEFLKTGRGIPFSQMFAMKEYPQDVMPLYSQGYSVCSWLINSRGRETFMRFVADGLKDDNWPRAAQETYGFTSPLAMQNAWNEWVRAGRPQPLLTKPDWKPDGGPAALAESTKATPGVPTSSIGRVFVGDGSLGTGTLVGNDIVLTNWHLFRESQQGIEFEIGGTRIPGTLIDRDELNDLAAVKLQRSAGASPIQIAVGDELPTGELLVCGYGGLNGFQVSRGKPAQTFNPGSPRNPDVALVIAGAQSRPGDSGGPVLNTTMKLTGVVWGNYGGGNAYCCCGHPLRRFLDRILPGRPGLIIPHAQPLAVIPPPIMPLAPAQPSQPQQLQPMPAPSPQTYGQQAPSPTSPPSGVPPLETSPSPGLAATQQPAVPQPQQYAQQTPPPTTQDPSQLGPPSVPPLHSGSQAPQQEAASQQQQPGSDIGSIIDAKSLKWFVGTGTSLLGPVGGAVGLAAFWLARRERKKIFAKLQSDGTNLVARIEGGVAASGAGGTAASGTPAGGSGSAQPPFRYVA